MKVALIAIGKFIALAELHCLMEMVEKKGSFRKKNFSFCMEGGISLVFF